MVHQAGALLNRPVSVTRSNSGWDAIPSQDELPRKTHLYTRVEISTVRLGQDHVGAFH